MACRASQHDQLSAVVGFVCDEIREYMAYVKRQIPPDVLLRWRNLTALLDAKLENGLDAAAATIQSRQQGRPADFARIDERWRADAMFLAQCPDPSRA